MEYLSKRFYKPFGIMTYFLNYYHPEKLFLRNYCLDKNDVKKWYKTLGIAEGSDQKSVRIAYIELVKKYHPDISCTDNDSDKFVEIEKAYRNLQDKFSREGHNECKEEFGLYHKYQSEVKEADIDHNAPQHRQYLSFEGIGSGTPSERQKQYANLRATKASQNVTSYRIKKLEGANNKSLAVKEKKKIEDIKTRFGIERLVEDLIQESMSRGEFDNLPGSGKPLKLQNSHNPYVDHVTHKMNQVLIDNGFSPAWISLQREILDDKERIETKLMKSRQEMGSLPLTKEEDLFWQEVKSRLVNDVKCLNKKIDNYNLVVPILNKQKCHYNLEKEADLILKKRPPDGKVES